MELVPPDIMEPGAQLFGLEVGGAPALVEETLPCAVHYAHVVLAVVGMPHHSCHTAVKVSHMAAASLASDKPAPQHPAELGLGRNGPDMGVPFDNDGVI